MITSLTRSFSNFFQVCEDCEPQRVYWRLFDVTENTGLRRHKTMRKCHYCHRKLSDSIVHFGEKRQLSYPQNWEAAFDHAKETDTILCLGSSLKVNRFVNHGFLRLTETKVETRVKDPGFSLGSRNWFLIEWLLFKFQIASFLKRLLYTVHTLYTLILFFNTRILENFFQLDILFKNLIVFCTTETSVQNRMSRVLGISEEF